MLRNYFKIAWRNLQRNKNYTAINVVGLALGIACMILIVTLVQYHFSFDNFHNQSDRIYRVVSERHDDEINYSEAVPQPLGKAIRDDYSFAEKTARVLGYGSSFITIPGESDDKKFEEEPGIAYAEPEFFEIMNFPVVEGNKNRLLQDPNTALVTERIARKYFGNENPLGKTIRVNKTTDFTITGILKDLPANTDRRNGIYVSYHNLKEMEPVLGGDSSWTSLRSRMNCFVLLKPGVTAAQVNAVFPQVVKKYYSGRNLKRWQFKLQPLADIHFNPDFSGIIDKKYLWALLIIGVFLIVTACVNFINLATAQALNRSKEVGIRKVAGGRRSQLFWQFMAETALITLFAAILACGIAYLLLPQLNRLLETNMTLQFFSNGQLAAILLSTIAFVTFLSGSYPALILARFQPILALKSKISQKHIGGISLRRILVVTQFAISQILIIGAIVIASQMRFAKNSDLGFTKEAIVLLPVPEQEKSKLSSFKKQLASLPGVEAQSLCFRPPASSSNKSTSLRFNNSAEPVQWQVNLKFGDEQYLSTFGLELVAGRNYFATDTVREMLVNETVARKLHVKPEEMIGKTISLDGGQTWLPVAGVVKDFYNNSFYDEISGVCILPGMDNYSNCAVKINPENIPATLAAFQTAWNASFPQYLYSFEFLDEDIAAFYELETVLMKLVQAFALVAILIGCLGLYGLVSFMAIRRTKEIGVRKVLGASVQQILWLFGKEISRLLLLAFLVAAPFAWWVMNLYLRDFTYRIPVSAGIFLTAIAVTFAIAGITVGYRSLRSALANPVKSLRTE